MKKKLLCILLVVAVIASVFPMSTLAASDPINVENPFVDVVKGSYYHDAVLWALNASVTSGTSPSAFSPTSSCTRGQVVTFLWRSLGCPTPANAVNRFSDVTAGAYYYNAVLWAVGSSVTSGTSATAFSPNETCTSAQVITFLWRSNGRPAASAESRFSQTYPDKYYTDAVAWADTTGLLSGIPAEFSPNAMSPRADIVTYLYKNAGATPVNETRYIGPPRSFSAASIPAYSGSPYTAVNGNNPFFTAEDYTTSVFEKYTALDALGRCGVAYANICKELMPTEDRGSIGTVKPSGWQFVKYDSVDGGYLYNRCHLIGFQLAGENANTENLITGTRYLNVNGMLPFENMVADYVKETGNHVQYRVTPIFAGSNLVASGVLMEARSVEDNGAGILFCVYCYNVQPGITINYANGVSKVTGTGTTVPPSTSGTTYILNTNTHKFHLPSCSSVQRISPANKQTYTGDRNTLISSGYDPCGICNP